VLRFYYALMPYFFRTVSGNLFKPVFIFASFGDTWKPAVVEMFACRRMR